MLVAMPCWAQDAAVQRPSMKVGDKWAYEQRDKLTGLVRQTSTLEVVAVETDGVRARQTVNNGEPTEDNTYDLDGNTRRADGRTFTPFRQFYAFPLHVGKTWSSRMSHPSLAGNRTINAEMKGSVVGWESVTVPAGTFKVAKIVIDQPYYSEGVTGGGRGVGRYTIWYAPEVKRLVQLDYDERPNHLRVQLTSFELK
jgi:hypothetical protein